MQITLPPDTPRKAGQTIVLACGQSSFAPVAHIRGRVAPRHVELPAGTVLADADGRKLLQILSALHLPAPHTGDPLPPPAVPGFLARCLDELPEGPVSLELTPAKTGYALAWITLSDKGARGERVDTAGPAVESTLRDGLDVCLAQGYLLPDDMAGLKGLLMRLALLDGFDLIVTTGGTGVAPRDITPEATLAVIERRLPGFEAAMIAASAQKTPHGIISRAVVGTLGQSLIINLPGSPKAVRENLAAILKAVGHTLDKLKGDPADCGR